jgi:hypothetical protein
MPTPSLSSYDVVSKKTSTPNSASLVLNITIVEDGVSTDLEYLEFFIHTVDSSAVKNVTTVCVGADQLNEFFSAPANSDANLFPRELLYEDLPFGDKGAAYSIYGIEHYSDGTQNDNFNIVKFTRTGPPGAPSLLLVNSGDLSNAINQHSTGTVKGVKRTGHQFNVLLRNVTDGGSPFKRVYWSHMYEATGADSKVCLQRNKGSREITAAEIKAGLIELKGSSEVEFGLANVDTTQTTHVILENEAGRNGPISNIVVTSNDSRVVIAKDSILSVSYADADGVDVELNRNFYQLSDPIKISVIARVAGTSNYSTTNVINVDFDPAEALFAYNVSQIFALPPVVVTGTGSTAVTTQPSATLLDLPVNIPYEFALVAASDDIAAALILSEGKNSLVVSQSETSNNKKGQAFFSTPLTPLPLLAPNLTVDTILAPDKMAGGIRVSGVTFTPSSYPENAKPHQSWTLSKVENGVATQLASDITQFSGSVTDFTALKSFTVPKISVNKAWSYELAVVEVYAIPPAMITCFPSITSKPGVMLVKNINYIPVGAVQKISFKDKVDPATIEAPDCVVVSAGRGVNNSEFLVLTINHADLSDKTLSISKLLIEVSTSDTFANPMWISSVASDPEDSSSAFKELAVEQDPKDPNEHAIVYIYQDPAGAKQSEGQPLCPGAVYHVRVRYSVQQTGYSILTASSNYANANTEVLAGTSSFALPGPASVSATADVINKKITGFFIVPSPSDIPNGVVTGALIQLYGSDVKNVLQEVRNGVNTMQQVNTNFSFSLKEIQSASYNIYVTLDIKVGTELKTSTRSHTSVPFASRIKISGYDIIRPPSTTRLSLNAITGQVGLRIRVTLTGDVQHVLVAMPHANGQTLVLTQGLPNVWSANFSAMATPLLFSPTILAIGLGGDYDVECDLAPEQ